MFTFEKLKHTMLRSLLYQTFSFLYFLSGFGQGLPLKVTGKLSKDLEECSGITQLPSGKWVMINDSGNPADLYFTDSSGTILKKVSLSFATNLDWEEIQYDHGYIYLGDFGNNNNNRQDLKIYRLGLAGDDSVYNAGIIHFSYKEQNSFPPPPTLQNFDMEAMVLKHDSIFLFSKNRTVPFTGYTYLYGMPDIPGKYVVSRLDSFKTGTGIMASFWVAGAALNPDKDKLALIGYDKMWLFQGFSGTHFFQGKATSFGFHKLTQKESIAFVNDSILMITEETNPTSKGYVYQASLPDLHSDELVFLKSEVIKDSLMVSFDKKVNGTVNWEIFDTDGHRILFGHFDANQQKKLTIDVSRLNFGNYVLNILIDSQPHAFRLKKPMISKN